MDVEIIQLMTYMTETVEWLSDRNGVFRDLCPHCHLPFEVLSTEINCGIFRHGMFKNTGQLISPHAPKDQCDSWHQQGLIWGCGKPCRFNGKEFESCDYI